MLSLKNKAFDALMKCRDRFELVQNMKGVKGKTGPLKMFKINGSKLKKNSDIKAQLKKHPRLLPSSVDPQSYNLSTGKAVTTGGYNRFKVSTPGHYYQVPQLYNNQSFISGGATFHN